MSRQFHEVNGLASYPTNDRVNLCKCLTAQFVLSGTFDNVIPWQNFQFAILFFVTLLRWVKLIIESL